MTANLPARIAATRFAAQRKINKTNDLQQEMGSEAHCERRSFRDRRANAPCQSGTSQTVPFRYAPAAPRLDAAFVAQFLGQVMPDLEQAPSDKLAAYAGAPDAGACCNRQF